MMKYYRPETVNDALRILGSNTEICLPLYFPPRAKHIAEWKADAMVELSALNLDSFQITEKEVILGSMVSFETLTKSEALTQLWDGVLSEAARLSGTGALRNLASVGGILLNPNYPAEVTLMFLAMDAKVVLMNGNGDEKTVSIEAFLQDGKPELPKGSLIKEVILPLSGNAHFVLDRVSRTKSDASIVSVVVKADFSNNQAEQLRIAIFGAGSAPKRFHMAEGELSKGTLSDDVIEAAAENVVKTAEPVGDYRGSKEYRTAMAGTLTKRALKSLASLAGK